MQRLVLLTLALAAVTTAMPIRDEETSTPLRTVEGDGYTLRDWDVENGFCDPSAKQTAGYFNVTTATKEYFYWFFEARNAPADAPVVLWMTGGPGCSSELALLVENGPCKVDANMQTRPNNMSWNTNANLLYIDQPADVGFSYGKLSDMDHDEAGVSRDMYNFLQAFFTAHPELQKNDFYVTGESYGGHYVPAVSFAVFNGNQNATANGKLKINLKGLAIGNGLTAPEIQYKAYPEMAYANNRSKPLVSKLGYDAMKVASVACTAAIAACQKSKATCLAALEVCNMGLVAPIQAKGVNLYDVRIPCAKPPLCYDFDAETKFMNLASTKKALGVGDRKWQSCNMAVNQMFHGDWMQHFQIDLPPMLAAGIRVLIYAGDCDYICNWIGNKEWTQAMDWPHNKDFNAEGDHPWMVNGQQKGEARTKAGFTFLRVYKAGHMVPMDQPEAALGLLDTFINDKPFY